MATWPIVGVALRARACGDPGPTFVPAEAHADAVRRFVGGQSGLISPRWDTEYLVIAYRQLVGLAASRAEIDSLLEELLGGRDPGSTDPAEPWRQARLAVIGDAGPRIVTWRATRHHAEYDVCPIDAFRTAAATIRARAATWGATSVELRDWVTAQDRVFAACASTTAPAPDEPARDWSPQRAADRRYQLAASNLYRERFAEARRGFDAIATDSTSPWREIAPYLAARTLLRESTLRADPFDGDTMRLTERRLASLVADATRPAMHDPARRMLDLVRFRLDPDSQTRTLAAALARPNAGADAGRWMTDLVRGWGRVAASHAAREQLSRNVDLLAWLDAFTRPSPMAVTMATRRLSETGSVAWLVAASTHATHTSPDLADILDRAARIAETSPAYPTVAFHRVRLLAVAGRTAEARRLLRGLRMADWPVATRDAFRALALYLAPDTRSWLLAAQRTEMLDAASSAPALHEDARRALRAHMPLERVEAIVSSDILDPRIRAEISRAGFLRAVVLERHGLARRFATRLLALEPTAADSTDLRDYLGATRGDQTAVGLLAVSRNDSLYGEPSISSVQLSSARPACPDGMCDVSTPAYAAVAGLDRPSLPADLGATERARGEDEARRMVAEGTLLNLIGRHVLAWAERDPSDPRVPESLHRFVAATRRASMRSLSDERTGQRSRRAHSILHRRHPNDEWTRRTRHWYR